MVHEEGKLLPKSWCMFHVLGPKKTDTAAAFFGRNSRTRPPPTLNNLLRAPQAPLVCKSQASPLCVLALHALQEERLK